ncbi:MAG: sigma 54-interacting transcriptional regulator [Myxococcota bacterium]
MSRGASDSTTNLVLKSEGYELLVTRDGSAFSVPLPPEGELLIGRAEDAQVRLAGSSVSRRHALLRATSSGFALQDLGSSNGTLIRGERAPMNRELPLVPGDSLLVGDFVLTLRARRIPTAISEDWGAPNRGDREAGFVRQSRALEALYRQTDPVARSKINVLILGETGVGKDVLARSIHDRSERRAGPFLRLNCAALSEPLLESELFGHEKGAFTGAARSKPGLLLAASGGSVFLDEVGELPRSLQPKLLQVLETQEILSVGSVRPRSIDVRFIAATNRDLEQDIIAGNFRSDLYYRLAAFTAVIPPLRERQEDVVPIAREFLRRATETQGARTRVRLSQEAESRLLEHSWPGNARELRNVIERAVVLCENGVIAPEHLQLDRTGPPRAAPTTIAPAAMPAEPDSRNDLPIADLSPKELEERERILNALQVCAGNQSKAADMLEISRSTLLNRLDAYRIGRPRKRSG